MQQTAYRPIYQRLCTPRRAVQQIIALILTLIEVTHFTCPEVESDKPSGCKPGTRPTLKPLPHRRRDRKGQMVMWVEVGGKCCWAAAFQQSRRLYAQWASFIRIV